MDDAVMKTTGDAPVDEVLRDELAQGDRVLGTIGPVLGHLLANQDHSLFSDEIVSRVRGMVGDIARQLLVAQAELRPVADPQVPPHRSRDALSATLLADMPLVIHCHAKALEWQLTARLEARNALDPVLSPLLQALIASDDGAIASGAMAALAAQARFVQQQRRMELPLGELPADLFHTVLEISSAFDEVGGGKGGPLGAASAQLRATYDESQSRLGLLARLVEGMGAGALAALSLSHGGAALFLSALAALTHQNRDAAIVTTNQRQLARLSLSLRAAGLKARAIEEQFALIHPDATLPGGLDTLPVDRAAGLLATSNRATMY